MLPTMPNASSNQPEEHFHASVIYATMEKGIIQEKVVTSPHKW